MRQICYISEFNIPIHIHINRELFGHFAEVFEQPVLLDVSSVFTSKLWRRQYKNAEVEELLPSQWHVERPKSLLQCARFFKDHDVVAICGFPEIWKDWYLHYYLTKFSIPLIYVHTHSIVQFSAKKASIVTRVCNRIIRVFDYRPWWRHFCNCVFPSPLAHVDTIYVSTKDDFAKRTRSQRYQDVVLVNSKFYDSILAGGHVVSSEHVAFLDSMMPHHADQIQHGYHPVDRRTYYQRLNWLFDVVEQVSGKKVIICLHPKYPNECLEQNFGGRTAIKYETDGLVARASLVLFHESSSVNTAVFYKKPVLQLVGDCFNDFVKNNCAVYNNLCSFPRLDMFTCDEKTVRYTIQTIKPDLEKYQQFISTHIIASEEEGVTSAEQIATHLAKKYSIAMKSL